MTVILKDSLHPQGYRFRTFLLSFPKTILAELNTHRQLVRNVASSRAIPTAKYIENILANTYIPPFTKNQSGMQGDLLDEESEQYVLAKERWELALQNAIEDVLYLKQLQIHKQDVNRLLDPFANVSVVLSGTDTEFDHFFALRNTVDTQPIFSQIAEEMYDLYKTNIPQELDYGEWHVPFDSYMYQAITEHEKLKVAIARIARVSYENHYKEFNVDSDLNLYNSLVKDRHLTPLEHVAKVVRVNEDDDLYFIDRYGEEYNVPAELIGNFSLTNNKSLVWTRQYKGFYTYRHIIEDRNYDTEVFPISK